ncbi:MAG: hypothetical protein WA789_06210 [Candidatus Acidiferrum sp.]
MFMQLLKSTFGKAAVATVLLGGALLLGGAPNAQANERGRVVRYDNLRVHEAIVRRGFYSPQANYWRLERREAIVRGYYDRFGCWHRY